MVIKIEGLATPSRTNASPGNYTNFCQCGNRETESLIVTQETAFILLQPLILFKISERSIESYVPSTKPSITEPTLEAVKISTESYVPSTKSDITESNKKQSESGVRRHYDPKYYNQKYHQKHSHHHRHYPKWPKKHRKYLKYLENILHKIILHKINFRKKIYASRIIAIFEGQNESWMVKFAERTGEKAENAAIFWEILAEDNNRKYVHRLTEAIISLREWLAGGGDEIARYGCNVISWRTSASNIWRLIEQIIRQIMELVTNLRKISIRKQKEQSLRRQLQMDLLTTDVGENYYVVSESGRETSEVLPEDLVDEDPSGDHSSIGNIGVMPTMHDAFHFGKKFPTVPKTFMGSGIQMSMKTFMSPTEENIGTYACDGNSDVKSASHFRLNPRRTASGGIGRHIRVLTGAVDTMHRRYTNKIKWRRHAATAYATGISRPRRAKKSSLLKMGIDFGNDGFRQMGEKAWPKYSFPVNGRSAAIAPKRRPKEIAMAEREGFEPSVPSPAHSISSAAR